MKRFWVEIQIGFLVIVGVALVLATGYLAYNGMNSILASVARESKPDVKINLIQLLATDLEKAENSVRLYAYSRNENDLQPYYLLVTGVDEQINRLREEGRPDEEFSRNMDTIGYLVEQKILTWNEMLPLYQVQQAERYLDTISRELENKIVADSIRESRNIFQKIFKRQEKVELDEAKIVKEIEGVKTADSVRVAHIRSKEQRLAISNSRLTGQFYDLVKRMEEAELRHRRAKAAEADELADEAYRWIGYFSLSSVIALVLVIMIITRYARKSHKYQLALVRARNEAENLARAKELFVANVSHELRTPMNVISGFLGQLLKKPQDKENRETLEIIKSSADHLVRIVNDILDFSKLDSGKMLLEPIHFRIRGLLYELELLFRRAVEEKQVTLEMKADESVPDVLLGDPIRLKQILINLLGNAIKFTEQGQVEVSLRAQNQLAGHLDLMIRVRDSGIGIAAEKLRIIFDDFTQAEAGTTQKYGGTGLGLSIVKKLVELHHGEIKVESKLQEGTLFTCRIPYRAGDESKLEQVVTKQSKIPETVKKLKVLVVDDEAYNRKLVAVILKKWELEYEEAQNGLQAVTACSEDAYDVVLMDNRMPEMDGLEASRKILELRGDNRFSGAIVFFSAATASENQLATHRKLGIRHYLPKPFTEEELLQVLMKIANVSLQEALPVQEPEDPVDSAEPTSVIDLDQLYRVAGDDQAFVAEMLERFIESFESGYARMHESAARDVYADVADAAHKLASPCRHLGADRLLQILKKIESDASIETPDPELSNMVAKARIAFDLVKKEVLDHLAGLKK